MKFHALGRATGAAQPETQAAAFDRYAARPQRVEALRALSCPRTTQPSYVASSSQERPRRRRYLG